jgi:hypothetical protein
MQNTRPCFARTALSVALVASILGLNFGFDPAMAQKETNDGVTVQKNADGSVEAYDAGGADELGEDGGASGAAPNDGRIHYRPGTSPYQKKFSDGTTVRRNSDGSIETWDEGETQHISGGGGSGSSHRRTVKKSAKTAVKKKSTAAKKKS